ncbi:hypothetical protein BGZ54_008796 [Gamsiella multidivaricata]|nr:hypothetical protein BGZ54_008796 [Gamsiella multidivaricata]
MTELTPTRCRGRPRGHPLSATTDRPSSDIVLSSRPNITTSPSTSRSSSSDAHFQSAAAPALEHHPQQQTHRIISHLFVDPHGRPLQICLSRTVKDKVNLENKIKDYGGVVTPNERVAFISLADPGLSYQETMYSTEWVDQCIQQQELLDHDIPKFQLKEASRTTWAYYTRNDDRELREYVEAQKREGKRINGNNIYQTFAVTHKQHSWHSWRNRAIKVLKLTSSVSPYEINKAKREAQLKKLQDQRAGHHLPSPGSEVPINSEISPIESIPSGDKKPVAVPPPSSPQQASEVINDKDRNHSSIVDAVMEDDNVLEYQTQPASQSIFPPLLDFEEISSNDEEDLFHREEMSALVLRRTNSGGSQMAEPSVKNEVRSTYVEERAGSSKEPTRNYMGTSPHSKRVTGAQESSDTSRRLSLPPTKTINDTGVEKSRLSLPSTTRREQTPPSSVMRSYSTNVGKTTSSTPHITSKDPTSIISEEQWTPEIAASNMSGATLSYTSIGRSRLSLPSTIPKDQMPALAKGDRGASIERSRLSLPTTISKSQTSLVPPEQLASKVASKDNLRTDRNSESPQVEASDNVESQAAKDVRQTSSMFSTWRNPPQAELSIPDSPPASMLTVDNLSPAFNNAASAIGSLATFDDSGLDIKETFFNDSVLDMDDAALGSDDSALAIENSVFDTHSVELTDEDDIIHERAILERMRRSMQADLSDEQDEDMTIASFSRGDNQEPELEQDVVGMEAHFELPAKLFTGHTSNQPWKPQKIIGQSVDIRKDKSIVSVPEKPESRMTTAAAEGFGQPATAFNDEDMDWLLSADDEKTENKIIQSRIVYRRLQKHTSRPSFDRDTAEQAGTSKPAPQAEHSQRSTPRGVVVQETPQSDGQDVSTKDRASRKVSSAEEEGNLFKDKGSNGSMVIDTLDLDEQTALQENNRTPSEVVTDVEENHIEDHDGAQPTETEAQYTDEQDAAVEDYEDNIDKQIENNSVPEAAITEVDRVDAGEQGGNQMATVVGDQTEDEEEEDEEPLTRNKWYMGASVPEQAGSDLGKPNRTSPQPEQAPIVPEGRNEPASKASSGRGSTFDAVLEYYGDASGYKDDPKDLGAMMQEHLARKKLMEYLRERYRAEVRVMMMYELVAPLRAIDILDACSGNLELARTAVNYGLTEDIQSQFWTREDDEKVFSRNKEDEIALVKRHSLMEIIQRHQYLTSTRSEAERFDISSGSEQASNLLKRHAPLSRNTSAMSANSMEAALDSRSSSYKRQRIAPWSP